MLPEMTEVNHAIEVVSIDDFERAYDVKLPILYREFLSATNGGRTKNRLFPVRNRPNSPVESVLDFLGLNISDFPTLDLKYPIELYAGGLPKSVVPIAVDDFGSYICIDLRNGKERVVFWDHRHFWSTGEWREQDLYHVADSFGEFLGLLRPSDS